MSAKAILTPLVSTLSAAAVGIIPGIPVVVGIPTTWATDALVYLWRDDVTDYEQSAGGVVRRTHHLIAVALVRADAGDDRLIEDLLLDLSDALMGAVYGNRKLGGACSTLSIRQHRLGTPYVNRQDGAWFRAQGWGLDATETLQFVMH